MFHDPSDLRTSKTALTSSNWGPGPVPNSLRFTHPARAHMATSGSAFRGRMLGLGPGDRLLGPGCLGDDGLSGPGDGLPVEGGCRSLRRAWGVWGPLGIHGGSLGGPRGALGGP